MYMIVMITAMYNKRNNTPMYKFTGQLTNSCCCQLVTVRSIMDSLVMVTRSSWLVLAIFCSSINWSVNIREINMQDGVWSSTCRPITQLTSHLFFGMTVHGAVWDLNSKLPYPPPPTQYCKNYQAFGLIVLFFSATLLLILRYLYFQTGTL